MEILEYWDFGILRYRNIEISDKWEMGIWKLIKDNRILNIDILDYWDIGILRYWNIEKLEYWDIGILKY